MAQRLLCSSASGRHFNVRPRLLVMLRARETWRVPASWEQGLEDRPLLQYGVAVAAVAAVTLLRFLVESVLQGRTPYTLYYLAILLAAWCCGIGPTLLAVGLSLAAAWFFFVPTAEPGNLAALILFLAVAGAMVVLSRVARQGRRFASEAATTRARLAAIVESSDDAILTKNLDGIIQSANAGAERLFGYSAAELVGQPVTMLIPGELQAEEVEILRRVRNGERVEHFETVRLTKDGRRLDLALTIPPS